MARPFLKWAGGKTQLLPEYARLYPKAAHGARYIEPFLGGGAVFFHVRAVLAPTTCILADDNPEIINVFEAVQNDVEGLISRLREHRTQHLRAPEPYYYSVRSEHALRHPLDRAARLIYLNKTCFNGLYRLNSKGEFNVPFGHRSNPGIYDEDTLRAAGRALASVQLVTRHFRGTLQDARPGDFIYFDPPYDPVSDTADFTSYTEGPFGKDAQEELALVFRELAARGCHVMLSNSHTPFVLKLYRGFNITTVFARRSINSKGRLRGPVKEVVVRSNATTAGIAGREPRTSTIRLTRIYTKKGDTGDTRLVGGRKVRKDDLRVECYGTVDELLACLGLVTCALAAPGEPAGAADLLAIVRRLQNELFNLGSELATPPEDLHPKQPVVADRHVAALEREIDAWNASLPALRSFVLPGGGQVAAGLHLARTVCRRAERLVVRMNASAPVRPEAIRYLNRLSDHLFVMSRHAARVYGEPEPLWQPEKT